MTTRRWLAAIVLVAAGLRFYAIGFGLPYAHARPDETTTLGLARQVRAGDLNPHSFHWGSLSIYAFAAVHVGVSFARRLAGLDPALSFATLVMSARAAVAVAGTVTVLVLFRMGTRTGGTAVGLLAAFFLSVSILHVRESHFAMTDTLMTLFLTCSLALLLEAMARDGEHRPSNGWYAAAGLAGGLATSTKYSAAVVVAAMGAAQLDMVWRGRWRARGVRAFRPAVAFAAAFLLGFVAGSPYAALDFETFAADVRFESAHLAAGHGVDLGRGWVYHVTRSLPLGLGTPMFVAALAGIVVTARRHPRQAIVLFGFAGAYYILIGGGRTVFFRYVLPLVPVLCLSAAILVRELVEALAARLKVRPALVTAPIVLLVAGPSLVNSVWFDLVLARADSRVVAAERLTPRLRPGDTIYDNGGAYAELHLPPGVHYWQYDAASGTFLHANGRTPDWLVLHESPLDAHAAAPRHLVEGPKAHYDLAFEVRAAPPESDDAVYDRQDVFFMPLARLWTIDRPGPTIRIYRRTAAHESSIHRQAPMRAIAIAHPGGPEVLQLVDRPTPTPGAGELLVRVEAAGVNRPDLMQRVGKYPPPPGISDLPGLEVAGTIAAIGPGVTRWREGDTVCALVAGGGYAEYCIVPEPQALPLPHRMRTEEAAAIPETFFTVWTNVFERGRLAEGERILIHGGSSGIGTTAIQLARAFGATVFATAGSDDKCAACERLGARAINYRTADFVHVIKDWTAGAGVDVILDMVGGSYLPRNLDSLAMHGRLLQIGLLESPRAEINLRTVMQKRLTLTGSTLRTRSVEEKGAIARALEARVWPLLASRQVAPVIHASLPLADAPRAHQMLESGDVIGKVVLVV